MPITGPEEDGGLQSSPAPLIDHTLLKADATETQVARLCEEAVEHEFAAVCVPPVHVRHAAGQLYGTGVAVATVIGFPLGYTESETKRHEAALAVAAGAVELDMVINQGWAAAGETDKVAAEIAGLVQAFPQACVKVIIECCNLPQAAKRELTEAVAAAGAGFVKTSTGFGAAGATVADVRLLSAVAAGRIGVKAAGGIRSLADCRAMIDAGATRIGTSSGCAIMAEWRRTVGLA